MTVSSIIASRSGPNHGSKNARLRNELRELLLRYNFTHFITLASNHRPIGYPRMRALMKEWDARTNREINGPKWAKRPDERLVWFAFPEKMDVNIHWHLVVAVDPDIDNAARATRTSSLALIGEKHWRQLVSQGTFDCQTIDSKGVIEYITKMSFDEAHFSKFVLYREFMTL